jgi:hypothetical protein
MLLAICELYNSSIHGYKNYHLNGHYIIYSVITLDDFYSGGHIPILELLKEYYTDSIIGQGGIVRPQYKNYTNIRNYYNIIQNERYFQLQLIKPYIIKKTEDINIILDHPTYNIEIQENINININTNTNTTINIDFEYINMEQFEFETLEDQGELLYNYNDEYFATLHTYNICIIQRKWREKYKQIKNKKEKLKNLKNLVKRMYFG